MRNALTLRRILLLATAGIVAIGTANTLPLLAQSHAADAKPPTFEVASIKPTKFVPGPSGVQFLPGGKVTVTNDSLWHIILVAYGISRQQLADVPKYRPVLNEFFNIEAKAPANAIPQGAPAAMVREQLRGMLQSMLAERFKLKVHHDPKDLPVYALLVAKNGPKLQKAAERDCTATPSPCHRLPGGPASGFTGQTVTMSDLAANLSGFMERPVVDRTGLLGTFDIQVPPWSRGTQITAQAADDGREPAPDPSLPSIFTVMQEHLGLKLESTKWPVDVLVIDRVQHPTDN